MSIHHGSAGLVPQDTTQQQPANGNGNHSNGTTNGTMRHEVSIRIEELEFIILFVISVLIFFFLSS